MRLPNIADVALKLGLSPIRRLDTEWYFICPFCGDDKHGHLCIDLEKQVWCCPRCGNGGGIIKLVELSLNLPHAEARDRVAKMDFSNAPAIPLPTPQRKAERATNKEIDRTYRALLALLPLREDDKSALLHRGLSEAAIKRLGFKSTPPDKNEAIPSKLLAAGFTLKGVPGFYYQYGHWKIHCALSGYFVPYVHDGLLLCMQVRGRHSSKKFRYWDFSSKNLSNGCEAKGIAHEISFHDNNLHDVWLTEGAIKADVSSFLMFQRTHLAVPFVAFPGASISESSLQDELLRLKSLGVVVLHEALDMEKCGNADNPIKKSVQKAAKKVFIVAKKVGLEVVSEKWDTQKGIDDFLLTKLFKQHSSRH